MAGITRRVVMSPIPTTSQLSLTGVCFTFIYSLDGEPAPNSDNSRFRGFFHLWRSGPHGKLAYVNCNVHYGERNVRSEVDKVELTLGVIVATLELQRGIAIPILPKENGSSR